MFSSRLPARLVVNALTRAVEAARAAGTNVLDLTETNPTRVALPYPQAWGAIFDNPDVGRYRPEPFGLTTARRAVAQHAGGVSRIRDDQVVLTASTSEAYSFLFKLLCDSGDEVLVPRPSYPLFDHLTGFEHVAAVGYRLDPADDWRIDRASVERALSPRTRAILVVSPNNPTGSMLRESDRDWLVDLAARRDLALIADEVFAPFALDPPADAVSLMGESRALVFTLGGLSKSAGLPQMKVAWMTVSGPDALVEGARARLEIIADTYLSVSTPVQTALPHLLSAGRAIRAAITSRVRHNLDTLRRVVRTAPSLTLNEPEGGWSAVIRVPAILPEEDLVIRLLTESSVLVHPGYFFDFEDGAHVVVSLLPEPGVFDAGIRRVAATLHVEVAR